MLKGNQLITEKQKIVLQAEFQPSFTATVTEVEDNYFWVNLPKEGNQVLVLQEKQRVKVGISLPQGFYQAETMVGKLGTQNKKFYGLLMPENFFDSQERRFIRANHYTNVLFWSGDLQTQSALVNFSAGGMMVYLVPTLEEILYSGQPIKAQMQIDDFSFELDVKLAWQKKYDNIPFVGFQFTNLSPQVQGALALLSVRFTDKK